MLLGAFVKCLFRNEKAVERSAQSVAGRGRRRGDSRRSGLAQVCRGELEDAIDTQLVAACQTRRFCVWISPFPKCVCDSACSRVNHTGAGPGKICSWIRSAG
jgi:hypothetical protein